MDLESFINVISNKNTETLFHKRRDGKDEARIKTSI
jgi:hypothetical protein